MATYTKINDNDIVTINVGGIIHQTCIDTLKGVRYFEGAFDTTRSIFIDRSPSNFDILLDHLRGYDMSEFIDDGVIADAEFYGINLNKPKTPQTLTVEEREELINKIQICQRAFDLGWKSLENKSDSELLDYYESILRCAENRKNSQELVTLLTVVSTLIEMKIPCLKGMTAMISDGLLERVVADIIASGLLTKVKLPDSVSELLVTVSKLAAKNLIHNTEQDHNTEQEPNTKHNTEQEPFSTDRDRDAVMELYNTEQDHLNKIFKDLGFEILKDIIYTTTQMS